MRAWGRRHSYSFFSSLGAVMRNRVGTLMTVLVLGIAMLLPLGLYITLINLNRVDIQQEQWGALTVFMRAQGGVEAASALRELLVQRGEVESVLLISPQQGLDEFRDALAHGDILLMVDLPQKRVADIEDRVHHHHPETTLGGVGWESEAFGF